MERIEEEVYRLKHLMNLEKRDDFKMYNEFIKNSTLEQRRFKGVCWQPLKILEIGYGTGDYPYLVVERTKHIDVPHQFSSGKLVSLYLVNGDGQYDQLQATIHWAEKNKLKITLNQHDLPDWVRHSSIGINLLFDEKSYKEMDYALDALLNKDNKRARELFGKSIGLSDLGFHKAHDFEVPFLNTSQNQAMNQVLKAQDIAVIHGPPGTGKTTTLVETVFQLVKIEGPVLVCAPSNAACDLMAQKLHQRGLNTLRIGNPSRVDPETLSLTLDEQIATHDRAKDIKNARKKAVELRNMASKYKRNFGHSEREQRKMMYREAKQCANEAIELENYVIDDLLDKAEVICTTLVGANHRKMYGMQFKTVVIDEAAQSLEAACWIPILKADKVVLAGDPFQLPPTVKSTEAQKEGLDVTLIEKCIAHHPEVSLLTTQYRMNTQIMEFSNRQFYAGELVAHESVAHHTLEGLVAYSNQPLLFLDTAGTGFEEQQSQESRSLENPGEMELLEKHLKTLLSDPHFDLHTSIGIISPYKAQVLAMQEYFEDELLTSYDITINTIDSFQGQERDVIYISMVRSNDSGQIGFLSDLRRMNVAMTRAKKKLVILGDSGTLCNHKFYQDFMKYTEETNTYQSAFEVIYSE